MLPDQTTPSTSIPEIQWPAVPTTGATVILTLQFQMQQTQWWSADRIEDHQFRQLGLVLRHAAQHVPYYRKKFAESGFDPTDDSLRDAWTSLPILTREQVQEAGQDLVSRAVPKSHGKLSRTQTSGSTGRPVTTYRTGFNALLWSALTLRDHFWHRRDFAGKHAAIRAHGDGRTEPKVSERWGRSTSMVYQTGPGALMNVSTDVDEQRRWLIDQDPLYLLTYPTNLRALAACFAERGGRLQSLRQVRTMGESVPEGLHELCRQVWGVPLADMYSSEEVGYMALQCPDHEHYHVQSEAVYLEILDDEGRPCPPGRVGRVVASVLHNYAMPLIRYQIMDYAEVGEPCPCGRGLPVLNRILGRQRNMIVLPDGTQHWPSFPAKVWTDVAPIRQFQLVQRDTNSMEARVVTDQQLTDSQTQQLVARLNERLGHPFAIEITYMDRIERSKSGKYEDFVGLVEGE